MSLLEWAAEGGCPHVDISPRTETLIDYAVAADFFCVKHSRQKIGRPCVGRNGTVVSLPHWQQVARVSMRE
ncbi:MAG: hypothetical protein WBC78_15620 [Candidatus Sulfotelmatobacter sp.]